jgi:carbonic anhydrase
LVWNAKKNHNHNKTIRTHNITHLLTLYQIEIICSIQKNINNKNERTKIQDEIVHKTVKNVLSQVYQIEKKDNIENNKLIHKRIYLHTLIFKILDNLYQS